MASGVFVCFTPFFGLHFVLATAIAWAIRGNILAALLATFFGNPLTFPIIAEVSLEIGSRILGLPHDVHLPQIVEAFGRAATRSLAQFPGAVHRGRRPNGVGSTGSGAG